MKTWLAASLTAAGLFSPLHQPSAQVVGVYVLDRLESNGKEIAAKDFLMQFAKNLPEGFHVSTVHFAYIFDENAITAHVEMLANTEQLGFFSCAAAVSLPVRWQGGELTIPVSAKATSTFRDIDVEGAATAGSDEDIRCSAGLQHGVQKVELDGEEMRLKAEDSDQ